nr:Rhomboid family [uncultured bacterium]
MSFGIGGGFTPWVQRLIIINAVVWILQLVLPGLTSFLQFVPAGIIYRPWTVVTYMFAHDPTSFWHIAMNMLGLYFFGPPLEARWGSKEFLKFYFICGMGGALLSFLFAHSPIIGASAAVYGVMLGFAMNWPDVPIYIWGIFPVPAKVLVGLFAVFSLYSGITGRDAGVAHFAHLGGFAAAYLYLKFDRRGGGLFTRVRKMMTKQGMTVASGGGGASSGPVSRPGAVGTIRGMGSNQPRRGASGEVELLNELDRVLDKISTQGMNSLSPEERKLLDEASRRYRQN